MILLRIQNHRLQSPQLIIKGIDRELVIIQPVFRPDLIEGSHYAGDPVAFLVREPPHIQQSAAPLTKERQDAEHGHEIRTVHQIEARALQYSGADANVRLASLNDGSHCCQEVKDLFICLL